MAIKDSASKNKKERFKKRAKGLHAKSQTSRNKDSKNYEKPYNKQGR